MPRLAVVMVNWNTCALTRDCLKTLFPALEGLEAEVWMVDNASVDDSVAMFKNEFPQIRLIENAENVGFARANNQVLRTAEADYYLLLNTDTLVPRDTVREFCRFMDDHPEVGAVGPRLQNAERIVEAPLKRLPTLVGELRYALTNHFVPFDSMVRAILPSRRIDWRKIEGPTRAEWLSAACLMIRKQVIEEVGYLAEDYFLFSEENDYFYRMRGAGLYGCYLPETVMTHLIGVSRKKRGSIDSDLNFFRSRQQYFRKHHPAKLPLFKTLYLGFFLWSYAVAVLRRLILGRRAAEGMQLYGQLLRIWATG